MCGSNRNRCLWGSKSSGEGSGKGQSPGDPSILPPHQSKANSEPKALRLSPGLQAASRFPFSLQKFLNESATQVVFMIEGRRVLAGEAILSGATATQYSRDEVIEKLVREHSGLVYRIAYAVLRQHHDAEDAAQETFVRVLRCGPKLEAVNDERTWVARIAWRVAVDRSKRRGRKRETALDAPETAAHEIASASVPADLTLEGAQVGRVLEKLVRALPEKLRAPLLLSAIDDMSPREIAEGGPGAWPRCSPWFS